MLPVDQGSEIGCAEARYSRVSLVIFYFCVFEHFYDEVIKTNCKAILLLI